MMERLGHFSVLTSHLRKARRRLVQHNLSVMHVIL
jgi:hypothetical protein